MTLMTMQDINVGDAVVSTGDGEMDWFVGDCVKHSAVGDAAPANGCDVIIIFDKSVAKHVYTSSRAHIYLMCIHSWYNWWVFAH